jgi:poly(hydroxyalkanoate) granule-associated protein
MKAKKATAGKVEVKRDLEQGIDRVKEQSHNLLLAGVGAIARAQRQREERLAELVAEGRKIEPRILNAIESFKARLPKPADFNFGARARFDGSKIQSFFAQRRTETLSRLGLPTRKDVEALSRKVDKLLEMQRVQ